MRVQLMTLALFVAAFCGMSGIARAQVDLSGEWRLLMHEDQPQEGGTYTIPGHGRVADEADVVEYRDMLVIIRDRVQDMVTKGRTLDQVEAAKVTFDYDRRYSTPAWTSDQFVEFIVATLPRSGSSPSPR